MKRARRSEWLGVQRPTVQRPAGLMARNDYGAKLRLAWMPFFSSFTVIYRRITWTFHDLRSYIDDVSISPGQNPPRGGEGEAYCCSVSTILSSLPPQDKKIDSRADPKTGRSLGFPRSVLLGERNAIDRSLRPGCLVRKYRVDVFSQGDNADRCRVYRTNGKSDYQAQIMRARIVLLGVLLICTSVSTNFLKFLCNFFSLSSKDSELPSNYFVMSVVSL